jgi:MSHA biogenesis protein MshJ
MIHESWNKLLHRIDQMKLRERVLLLVTLAVALYYLGQSFFLTPLNRTLDAREISITRSETQMRSLERTAERLTRAITAHPNRAMRQEIAEIRLQTRAIDRQLRRKTTGLVNPDAMASLLEAVLAKQHGLVLIRAENLPPRPLLQEIRGARQGTNLFSHPLKLEFTGSYVSTLDYLLALNRLPWHFYWDRFDLTVLHYPQNRMTLVVHTLSLQRALFRS